MPELEYKTLERQIIELWKSRGLKVISLKVEPLAHGEMVWTVVTKEEGK